MKAIAAVHNTATLQVNHPSFVTTPYTQSLKRTPSMRTPLAVTITPGIAVCKGASNYVSIA
ncbi:MAG: hypothetical protein QXX87_01050 [Candidatus Jordarchaeales archaeon]